MKKKLLPFILGCAMVAAMPLAAHADETTTEQDSGNVSYNGFATVNTTENGDTPILTAIPECTMTIPKDTTIKRGSLSACIGRVTIDGKYFVKPYYIEVTADRKSFTLVDSTTGVAKTEEDALAKEDIIFDVATAEQETSGENPDEGTAAEHASFVQSGEIDYNNGTKKTTQHKTLGARRFWKNEAETGDNVENPYLAGEITPINGQNDIYVNVNTTQWTGMSGDDAIHTKPVGGKYSGNITFTAAFKDNFDSSTMNGNNVWFEAP